MSKKLMIIGAGGHGRVVADIAAACGYEVDFLDDSENTSVKASGRLADYPKYIKTHDFALGIGNNFIRQKLTFELLNAGAVLPALVHPMAVVSKGATIGCASVVVAGAVINTGAKIGQGVIINTCSSVDHDCDVGDFSHISVGAHVAGTVRVGNRCMIAAGATVINNISVCDDVTVGAGAVVVRNIEKSGTYIGVPAKIVKE